jgi:hypothetical protein
MEWNWMHYGDIWQAKGEVICLSSTFFKEQEGEKVGESNIMLEKDISHLFVFLCRSSSSSWCMLLTIIWCLV